jgi:primosomal protein DnaI
MEHILTKSKTIEKNVDKAYEEAIKKPEFMAIVKKANLSNDEVRKNVTKIEDTILELKNCQNCKGLYMCKNSLEGHIIFPETRENKLVFSYTPCRFQKKALEAKENKNTGEKEINNARMKDIDVTDKNRIKLIKWLKNFYDNYDPYKNMKGLYLHGSFGSGKTYLIAALLNELKIKKNAEMEIVYYPELLRSLKDDFSVMEDKITYLENVNLLLIDDIGAEKVTSWGRDEILGTILQYRMNNFLPTFLTSNLNIIELETHLSITKESEDVVKARRIIERIKQLTEDIELVSINRRK